MSYCLVEEEMQERASLYALGALSQHEARNFEEHLKEGCAACEAELSEFDTVVGKLAYGVPGAAPRAEARAKLLARLNAETEKTPPATPTKAQDDSAYLVVRADEGEWQQMCAGIIFKQLFADAERKTVTTLIRMQPGAHMPTHRHLGIEECYVIEGDVQANHETLRAGDYTCAMEGSVHLPISTVNGALLLIVGPERHEFLSQ